MLYKLWNSYELYESVNSRNYDNYTSIIIVVKFRLFLFFFISFRKSVQICSTEMLWEILEDENMLLGSLVIVSGNTETNNILCDVKSNKFNNFLINLGES